MDGPSRLHSYSLNSVDYQNRVTNRESCTSYLQSTMTNNNSFLRPHPKSPSQTYPTPTDYPLSSSIGGTRGPVSGDGTNPSVLHRGTFVRDTVRPRYKVLSPAVPKAGPEREGEDYWNPFMDVPKFGVKGVPTLSLLLFSRTKSSDTLGGHTISDFHGVMYVSVYVFP